MQFTNVATLLAGAATLAAAAPAPSPNSLKAFSVDGLHWSTTPSQTQVSLNITDPNTGAKAECYYSPVLIGGVYTCNNNNNFKYGFNDDLSEITVAVTFPKGTLDKSDAYYIANGTASTSKDCHGTTAGEECKGADHISIPIKTIQGVA